MIRFEFVFTSLKIMDKYKILVFVCALKQIQAGISNFDDLKVNVIKTRQFKQIICK